MLLLLTTLALASETSDTAPESAYEPVRDNGMRLFLGAGQATSTGGVSGAVELGFHLTRMRRRIGGEYGVSLSAYQVGQTTLPVFNLDGGLRWRPSPDWRVQPYVAGGLGVSFLIILPFPTVYLATGAVLQVGEVDLDASLRARQILDIYGQSSGVTVTTLEIGVGF